MQFFAIAGEHFSPGEWTWRYFTSHCFLKSGNCCLLLAGSAHNLAMVGKHFNNFLFWFFALSTNLHLKTVLLFQEHSSDQALNKVPVYMLDICSHGCTCACVLILHEQCVQFRLFMIKMKEAMPSVQGCLSSCVFTSVNQDLKMLQWNISTIISIHVQSEHWSVNKNQRLSPEPALWRLSSLSLHNMCNEGTL